MVKLKNPKKKALGIFGALVVVALLLPLFAAFEAHVINVKAHIENALEVSPQHIDLGTVFPQETVEATFTIALSESFMDTSQTRVKDVEYKITQGPKPIPGTSPTAYYHELQDLLYVTKDASETDSDSETTASLDKDLGDIADNWTVKLFVPCIEHALCKDHGTPACPTYPCGTDPSLATSTDTCTILPGDPPGSGTAGDYGADIWVEVIGLSYVEFPARALGQGERLDVYGNRVVWDSYRNGNRDVYMYDLSTDGPEVRISTNGAAQWHPAIHGNKIVWDDTRNGNSDIYMYDLSTGGPAVRVTTNGADQERPDIYGNKIVWQDRRNGYPDIDIYMYDLSTGGPEVRITSDGASQWQPAIHGNTIVWYDNRNGNWDIYMYDLSTGGPEVRITTNGTDQYRPDIFGDRIVWTDDRNGNRDIYMYDLSTGGPAARITTNGTDQHYPAIHGNNIVWTDHRNGNADTYMYNLSSGGPAVRITTNGADQYYAAIHGNNIVWQDYRNGYSEIYVATY